LLLRDAIPHLTVNIYRSAERAAQYRPYLERAIEHPAARLMWLIELMERYPGAEPDELIDSLIDSLIADAPTLLTKQDQSLPYYLAGKRQMQLQNQPAAAQWFEQSLRIWPAPENPAGQRSGN
jgi:hypothetical protein